MNYSFVDKCDFADGPGCRVALYISGCLNHCKNCHNPESWDFNYGKPFLPETYSEILKALDKDYIKGLSILGGEPLDQNMNALLALEQLAIDAHKMNKSVWLWTGHTITLPMLNTFLLRECDVVVDGPYINSQRDITLAFRGSKNQRVIDANKSRKQGKIVLAEEYI